MVKLILLSLTALATAATAQTTFCTNGLYYYCGRTLKTLGYEDRMIDLLKENGEPYDDASLEDTLFRCNLTKDGSISYNSFCDFGCEDGGAGESDWCQR